MKCAAFCLFPSRHSCDFINSLDLFRLNCLSFSVEMARLASITHVLYGEHRFVYFIFIFSLCVRRKFHRICTWMRRKWWMSERERCSMLNFSIDFAAFFQPFDMYMWCAHCAHLYDFFFSRSLANCHTLTLISQSQTIRTKCAPWCNERARNNQMIVTISSGTFETLLQMTLFTLKY